MSKEQENPEILKYVPAFHLPSFIQETQDRTEILNREALNAQACIREMLSFYKKGGLTYELKADSDGFFEEFLPKDIRNKLGRNDSKFGLQFSRRGMSCDLKILNKEESTKGIKLTFDIDSQGNPYNFQFSSLDKSGFGSEMQIINQSTRTQMILAALILREATTVFMVK